MNEIIYPEYIYHYTKAENLFKILPELKLKLSIASKTNDPIEYLAPGKINSCNVHKETTKEELIRARFYRKRNDWSSEQEWRIITFEDIEFCTIEKSLDSIILGRNFDKSLLPALKKMIGDTKIKIKNLKIDMKTKDLFC